MTAGGGILHDEVPSERSFREGGPADGVQLWVNLPSRLKFTPPRYQAITGDNLVLLSSHDGGVRGAPDRRRPRRPSRDRATRTPRSRTRTRRSRRARSCRCRGTPITTCSRTCCSARGMQARKVDRSRTTSSGVRSGDALTLRAADHQDGPSPALEVLSLGGLPIREPIVHYGPFVMNCRRSCRPSTTSTPAAWARSPPSTSGADPGARSRTRRRRAPVRFPRSHRT